MSIAVIPWRGHDRGGALQGELGVDMRGVTIDLEEHGLEIRLGAADAIGFVIAMDMRQFDRGGRGVHRCCLLPLLRCPTG